VRRLGLIVEGRGEQMALPGLVQRLMHRREAYDWHVATNPVRIDRGRFSQRFDDFPRAVRLSASTHDATLVVLDSDDDDPHDLEESLTRRAQECAGHRRTLVTPAVREFESWFLASLPELAGQGAVRPDASCARAPESYAGAKGVFASCLSTGTYTETVDQKRYARLMDLDAAAARSPSFARFVRAIDEIVDTEAP